MTEVSGTNHYLLYSTPIWPLGNEIDLLLYNHILIRDNNCKPVLNILLGLVTFLARMNEKVRMSDEFILKWTS